MHHCCVIGGAGFIGSHVVLQLVELGMQVTVVGRNPVPGRTLPRGVRYACGDYGEKVFLASVLKHVDVVIDLAYSTVPGTSFDNPVEDILTNLPAAVRFFEVASELPLQRVVVVSSGGTVYGQSNQVPIPEEHPTNPISPYGVTKLAIEQYARIYHELKGLPVVILRPSNAYGETQRAFAGQGFVATAIASVLAQREIVVYGEKGTVRDYVHVEDLARGIVAALRCPSPQACYNVGSGVGMSNVDVIDAIRPFARNAGCPVVVRHVSARRFDVAANVLDSRKLTRDTGWTPRIPFEEGLRRTWTWVGGNR